MNLNISNKRLKLLIVISICVILSFSIVFAAVSFGEFSCWYANANEIGYWTKSNIKIYKYKFAEFAMTQSNFDTISSYAADAWCSNLSRTYSFNGTESDCDLKLYGISRDQARQAGLSDDVYGIGQVNSKTFVGTGTYASSTKNVYSYSGSAILYAVWDGTSSNWNNTQWKSIFTHEFGHIMGYVGHDTSTSLSLMKASANDLFSSNITYPQTRDLNHKKNVN